MIDRCRWYENEELWETTCDYVFEFLDNGPEENLFKYCPFCGLEIEVNYEEE